MSKTRTKTLKVVGHPVNFEKQHKSDAGFDLRIHEDVTLRPHQPSDLIDLGVKVQIPDNCVGLIAVRSSLGKRGITLANSVGVIDSGYRGSIKASFVNLHDAPQTLLAGTRVAQLLVVPLQPVKVEFVEALDSSDRGAGGFGSTGSR